MNRAHKLMALAGLGALSLVNSPAAYAEAALAYQGDLDPQIAALPTGDQLVLQGQDGTIRFAGRDIALSGFSGVLGYASESAYLVTFDGKATTGELEAGRGRMMMFQPFGREAMVARFDARRLHKTLAPQLGSDGEWVMARLASVVESQDRGVFFGRLGRTSFNVATLGSTSAEQARRERVGGTQLRESRFVGDKSAEEVERDLIQRFVRALASGDSRAASEYLDPLPYGMNNMGGGGAQARMLMAQQLIARNNWQVFANADPAATGAASYLITANGARAQIDLRRTAEVAFVKSVVVED